MWLGLDANRLRRKPIGTTFLQRRLVVFFAAGVDRIVGKIGICPPLQATGLGHTLPLWKSMASLGCSLVGGWNGFHFRLYLLCTWVWMHKMHVVIIEARSTCPIPWKRSFTSLWVLMPVLGSGTCSSTRAATALNHWALFSLEADSFKLIDWSLISKFSVYKGIEGYCVIFFFLSPLAMHFSKMNMFDAEIVCITINSDCKNSVQCLGRKRQGLSDFNSNSCHLII